MTDYILKRRGHHADPHVRLLEDLEEHKFRAELAEGQLAEYRQAFAFLLTKDWYLNHVHEVRRHLLDN